MVVEIMQKDEGVLKQLQQDQLYKGQDNEGDPIRPEYYFEEYAEQKQRDTPSPYRDKFTPNLYLTGRFYSTIYVDTDINSIDIGSDDALGIQLEHKYGPIFGLNAASWKFYIDEFLRPELIASIRAALGL